MTSLNKFKLAPIKKEEIKLLRIAGEERFDFFCAAFLDTVLQPFHNQWIEFQMTHPRTLILGPRGSWKCVADDTLIPTPQGLKYIKEALPCETTLPFTTSTDFILESCLGETRATQLYSNGLDDILEIETEDGYVLRCTPEHRWLIWNGFHLKFREARFLTEHDRIVFRCDWRKFVDSSDNPFNVPPALWYSALAFFWLNFPEGWEKIWHQPRARQKMAIPLWRFFNHKEWKSIPPKFLDFLKSRNFDSPLIPVCLRECSLSATRTIAHTFWWYNQYVKFTEQQAIEVQKWFLNLGFPLTRIGYKLLQKSAKLRRSFHNFLRGHTDRCDYTESQIAELARLLAAEIQRDPFVLPIIKIRLEKDCQKNYEDKPLLAERFVKENIHIVPKLYNFTFLFRFPHFLQYVKSVRKTKGLTVDLSTMDGTFLANGAISHNSTVCGHYYSIWRALRNPNIRIGIISKSSLLSSSFVSKIKNILETNQRLRAVWPDLIQPDKAMKWNNVEVTLMRSQSMAEATFTALGVGSTLAGKHFDVIIFDDVVDVESRDSPSLRRKIWDWFRFVAMPTLSISHETAAHVIGTSYHRDDLYHKLLELEESQGGWRSLIQPAINPDGTSFWEEMFPLEKLQQIEAMYGPDVFRLQYQNDVTFTGGGDYITIEDFDLSYYEPHEVAYERLDVLIGVDLCAPGLEKTDRHSAFAIAAVGQERGTQRAYVLEYLVRKNLRLADQRDIVLSFYQKFPHAIAIQIEAFALQTYFHEYLEELDVILPIVKVRTGGSKESRVEFLSNLIRCHKLLIRRDLHNDFINEMVSFPLTTADLIDAIYIAVKGLAREPQIRFVSLR